MGRNQCMGQSEKTEQQRLAAPGSAFWQLAVVCYVPTTAG